jgi:S-formylglutathione hydrolase FrmB
LCHNGQDIWDVDSSINLNIKYETFISQELVNYMDKNYKTIATKNSRAITGFSMDGYGSLWASLHHSDIFGTAGNTSGAGDIIELTKFSIDLDIKA